jgi:hypothetical protein
MPLIEAISLMPSVWPEKKQRHHFIFYATHYYRYKTKQGGIAAMLQTHIQEGAQLTSWLRFVMVLLSDSRKIPG